MALRQLTVLFGTNATTGAQTISKEVRCSLGIKHLVRIIVNKLSRPATSQNVSNKKIYLQCSQSEEL